MSNGVPGHVMRSVYARGDGQPELRAGSYLTTDESPISERWGGWYVTGTHGRLRHMGNVIARGEDMGSLLDTESGANVTNLNGFLDTSPYLTRHSDIVALMVIEHQTHLQNPTEAPASADPTKYHQEGVVDGVLTHVLGSKTQNPLKDDNESDTLEKIVRISDCRRSSAASSRFFSSRLPFLTPIETLKTTGTPSSSLSGTISTGALSFFA